MKELSQKMGTHKFRFSDMMPHSWLYKLKGISRSSRKHFASSPKHLSSSPDASSSRKLRDTLRLSSSPVHHPQASPSKSPFKRRIKRKTVYKPTSRVKLFSSSPNSHGSLTSSRNHRSKPSSANAIVLQSSDCVSSPSDQNYGSARDPEPHCSVNIKDDLSGRKLDDVSQDPSVSANSTPLLVESVKEPPSEMRTQQQMKNSNASSSILANSSPVLVETVKEPPFEMRAQQKMKNSNAGSSILANSSPVLVETLEEAPFEMRRQQKMKRPSAGSSILEHSSPILVEAVEEPPPEMRTQQKMKKNAGAPVLANSSAVLVETVKEPPLEIRTQQKLKKPSSGSSGIRIRANSPKIARKKTKGRTSPESKKKGTAKSFAIVLTSVDPERDFKESMVEMIVENKIKEQKDLEDLLACYLSLNSSEYHDIIIKAFEKTWFHLTHLT